VVEAEREKRGARPEPHKNQGRSVGRVLAACATRDYKTYAGRTPGGRGTDMENTIFYLHLLFNSTIVLVLKKLS
jgi:hypothetical protein